MQAGAVVVAVQILMLERKMRKGVGPINNHFYATLSSRLADSFNWENLPRQIRNMTHQNHLRLRGDCLLKTLGQLLQALGWCWERDGFQSNSLSFFPLMPGCQHPRIILISG